MKIQVRVKKQPIQKYPKCDYICVLNIQLRKHIQSVHQSRCYKCKECSFSSEYIADAWKHTNMKHGLNQDEHDDKFVIKMLAEQNADLVNEMKTFKTHLQTSFDNLSRKLLRSLKNLKEDTDNKCKSMGDTMTTIQEAVKKGVSSKPSDSDAQNVQKPAVSVDDGTKAKVPQMSTSKTSTYASVTVKSNANSLKSKFNQRPKVLFIGDSVSQNVRFPTLEDSHKLRIRNSMASRSVPNSRSTKQSFFTCASHLLENPGRDEFKAMILSAPTADITDMNTSKLTSKDDISAFQDLANKSSKNMITLAEDCLKKHKNLQKVVILEHPPRFDSLKEDPISLKTNLAKLANETLHNILNESSHREKI